MKQLLILFVCCLHTQQITKEYLYNLVIWNTGQGSWATYVENEYCHHFDMGGEKFNQQTVLQLCKTRKNQLYISHQDWDHINKINNFSYRTKNFCIYFPNKNLKNRLSKLKRCKDKPKSIVMIYQGSASDGQNGKSIVYLLRNQVLFPGDSTTKQEKIWTAKVPKRIKILVLGHHGSKTSTSIALLKRSRPMIAIASARKARYGHPHPKVVRKLKKFKIPLLKTEELGNIFLNLE